MCKSALYAYSLQVYYDFSDAILPPAILSNAPKKIFMDQTVYLATKTSIYLSLVFKKKEAQFYLLVLQRDRMNKTARER